MSTQDVLDIFRQRGALLTGHFILSSGRRSPYFLQKSLVFADPVATERLCHALAALVRIRHGHIDVVCGPAVGGIIPAYETARALGCSAMYTERDNGVMTVRRHFSAVGRKLLLMEDHVTTGRSMREAYQALIDHGCRADDIVGTACIVDRSGGQAITDMELTALATVDFPDYAPDRIPPELAVIPPVKPGSRPPATLP